MNAVLKVIMKRLIIVLLLALGCGIVNGAQTVHSICNSNSLSPTDATFLRPRVFSETQTNGVFDCAANRANTVPYDQFEFNLASCGAFPTYVVATLCDSGTCSASSDPSLDTILFIYRTGGSLTDGTGLAGPFDPAQPCNNLAAVNDDLLTGCSVGPSLSGLTVPMGPGRFVVVVCAYSTNAFNQTNGIYDSYVYNLSVSATNSGCSLTQVAGCPSVIVSSSRNPVPASGVNTPFPSTTFSATGGIAPYLYSIAESLPAGMSFNAATATLSGTPTQAGFFPLTVTGRDSNNCPGSLSFNLLITNVSLPCITGQLLASGPTFNRPDTITNAPGVPSPCTQSGLSLPYRAYEVYLSGCTNATVIASLCAGPGCDAPTGDGALSDSVMLMYRTSGTNGPGLAGAFNPANPCNNLIAGNDDIFDQSSGGIGCGERYLSGLRRALDPGYFTVVVTAADSSSTGVGAFSLNISAVTDDTNCTPVVTFPGARTQLGSIQDGSKIVLFWPDIFPGSALQYCSALPTPPATGSWTTYPGPFTTNAATIFVTNSASITRRFYRLVY